MKKSACQIIAEAIVFALVLTVISFFNGGVRYPFGSEVLPPIWLQLTRNFIIYFGVYVVVNLLFYWLQAKIEEKRGKRSKDKRGKR